MRDRPGLRWLAILTLLVSGAPGMGVPGGCAMLADGQAPGAVSVAAVGGAYIVGGGGAASAVAEQGHTSAPEAAMPAGLCGPVAPAVTRGDLDIPAESSQPVVRLRVVDPNSGPPTSLFRPPRV